MSDVFARLEKLSAQLNKKSDSVAEALTRLESKLATLRLGVEVWLDKPLRKDPLTEDGEAGETISTYLGYAKVDGTWHIAVQNDFEFVTTGDPAGDRPKAIQQASREDRIKALQQIPELIKAIEARAEEELKKLESALDITENL